MDSSDTARINLQTSVRVPEHVLARRVGEELVMLNLQSSSYFGLNEVGARLMECVGTQATLEQVVEQLLREFEVPRDQLEVDALRLATEMIDAGLLEVEG